MVPLAVPFMLLIYGNIVEDTAKFPVAELPISILCVDSVLSSKQYDTV
jgi:hypothetical protein